MKNQIPVSVIMPCHNSLLTLERSFFSILNQSAPPMEIILVDDCSTDNTSVYLKRLKKLYPDLVEVVFLDRNFGAAHARNVGWEKATQPYIAFLDSDDSWHTNKLLIQYDHMKTNPLVDFTAHQCSYETSNIITKELAEDVVVKKIRPHSLVFKNQFSTPTVMMKKNIELKFPTGRRYAEDLFLWQQIAFSGYTMERIELPLAYIHKPIYGVSGLSANLWQMEKGELKNLYTLLKMKQINIGIFVVAFIFSIIKYIRRVFFNKLNFLKPKTI